MKQTYHHAQSFKTESGVTLPELDITYHTYGELNDAADNVIWVCHALTANSDCADWWPGMIGPGMPLDSNRYYIVCANILGSCYGTTGPSSINPATGQPYLTAFPSITIRDMVHAHMLLREHLGIKKIQLMVGGSMGGYQAMEWVLIEPKIINKLCLLATSPAESAWGIAIHTAQRLAVEADVTWNQNVVDAGSAGLKAARAIGMLTYRTYQQYKLTQSDADMEKTDLFRASSYIIHQANKLVNRFHTYSYWLLTKAMDSHNICRGRNSKMEEVLSSVHCPALIISISSDILCPPEEQRFMADHIPGATYREIHSDYGHDGFLIESGKIGALLRDWL